MFSDGERINFRASGVDKNYPMREVNCYVTVPDVEFVAEGVIYKHVSCGRINEGGFDKEVVTGRP